ncbi:MAG: hypothetical protein ACTSR8_03790 [Promethearchaeota archaeon]
MKNTPSIVLNIITLIAFIFYVIGIFLETFIMNKRWGNSAVDYSLTIFGPILGLALVVLIGGSILLVSYLISKLKRFSLVLNIFLCWFWILSLYQCAINSFLSFYGLPNEPINQFFKTFFPNFWYPIKELIFMVISCIFTYFWMKNYTDQVISIYDLALIIITMLLLIATIIWSQLHLINSQQNVYS